MDHIGGVKGLLNRFDAPVYASGEDEFLKEISMEAKGIRELAGVRGLRATSASRPGRRDRPGTEPCWSWTRPATLPDRCPTFLPAAGCVFTGDLIFMIAVGRTDLPQGSGPELLASVRSRILTLPDETRIYSGHGPMTTVAHEKRYNPHFLK